jgi:hypothetical protein
MQQRVKLIPILRGQEARTFVCNATAQSLKKETVDFSKQSEQASKILVKAKLK